MINTFVRHNIPKIRDRFHSLATYAHNMLARLAWVAIVSTVGSTGAFAQISGGTDPATILQNIGTFILGPFGQSIAILGIISIGLAWMFGRASLGLIASVIGGIVIMFGAAFLGKTLVGG